MVYLTTMRASWGHIMSEEPTQIIIILLPDGTFSTIGGEDNDGRDGGLECAVQVGEALNVEHMNLVDEEHARHELGDALVNVLVHNFVDLFPQLV